MLNNNFSNFNSVKKFNEGAILNMNNNFKGELSQNNLQAIDTVENIANLITKCVNAITPLMSGVSSLQSQKRHRKTDSEFSQDKTGTEKKPTDFQYRKQIPLSTAIYMAENTPGVYVLYLDGRVMKCGRAAYHEGVSWRLRQYYNLNYDNQIRNNNSWSVTTENRDRIMVSWQCCPASKCQQLEYKLFQKYGKGEWAQRAPANCDADDWDLLI